MTDSKSPFRPSFLKIERAQRHLTELEQEIQKFLDSEPVKVRVKAPEEVKEFILPDGQRVMPLLGWTMEIAPADHA